MASRGITIAILLLRTAIPLWATTVVNNPGLNAGHESPDSDAGRINRALQIYNNRALKTDNDTPCTLAKKKVKAITDSWDNKELNTASEKLPEIEKVIDGLEESSDSLILALPPHQGDSGFARFLANETGPLERPRDVCLQLRENVITQGTEPKRELVEEAIINRRYRALKDFLASKGDAPANTLVQWAYLTGRPEMRPKNPNNPPRKAEEVLKDLVEIYGQEIEAGGGKPPLRHLEEKNGLKKYFTDDKAKLLDGRKLKLDEGQKEALLAAINRLQGKVEDVVRKFQGAPPGSIGQGPQLAQATGNQTPGSKSGRGGKRVSRGGQPPGGSGNNGSATASRSPAQTPQMPDVPKPGALPQALTVERPPEPNLINANADALGPRKGAPIDWDPAGLSNLVQGNSAAAVTAIQRRGDLLRETAQRADANARAGRSTTDGVAALSGRAVDAGRYALYDSLTKRRLAGARRRAAKRK